MLKAGDSLIFHMTPSPELLQHIVKFCDQAAAARRQEARALLEGIALYGIPVSAVLPYSDGAGSGEAAKIRLAQRFSQGWFVRR